VLAGRKRRVLGLMLVLAICIALAAVGCGGAGGGGGGGSSNQNKMTPGVYQVNVTGTTSGTTPLSHTMSVTLVVN
jgi:hypothetical protein